MWQRFTERARKVVFYAQEEAQTAGDGYVSTEHLLLGLIREPDSVGARVLEGMGLSLNRIRSEVQKQLPRGDKAPSQDMTLTPRAKRAIDLAYHNARQLNNNYIGTEHLLLGIMDEEEGLGARVLQALGAKLERARELIIEVQDFDRASPSDQMTSPKVSDAAGHSTRTLRETKEKVFVDGVGRGIRFVGTHDYLWEFLQREDCVAYRALAGAGVDIEALKTELGKVREIPPVSVEVTKDDPIAASAHAEASRIASTMSATANTGHLLLAMVVLSWSSVYLMISNTGVAYEHLWILVSQVDGED